MNEDKSKTQKEVPDNQKKQAKDNQDPAGGQKTTQSSQVQKTQNENKPKHW